MILAIAAGILLLMLFVAGIVVFVASLLRNATVTRLAMAYAKQDAAVVARLGQPIELGWLISGSIRTSGPSGFARLALPLRGAKRNGTLFAVAERNAGAWRFSTLVLRIEGESEPIDLLRR